MYILKLLLSFTKNVRSNVVNISPLKEHLLKWVKIFFMYYWAISEYQEKKNKLVYHVVYGQPLKDFCCFSRSSLWDFSWSSFWNLAGTSWIPSWITFGDILFLKNGRKFRRSPRKTSLRNLRRVFWRIRNLGKISDRVP